MTSRTGAGSPSTVTERFFDQPRKAEPALRRGRSWWRWAVVGIAADAVLLVGLAWWLFPSIWAVGVAVVDIDQSAGPDIGVVLSEVANNPKVMWGRTVTISAEVDEIYGPNAMLIGNDALFVGDKVLIVGATPLDGLVTDPPGGPIRDDDVVRVTGVVERFDVAALETRLGVDLAVPPDGYDGTSVLVATSVELDPPEHAGSGDKEFPTGSSGYEIGVTVNDIVARPDDHAGDIVVRGGTGRRRAIHPRGRVNHRARERSSVKRVWRGEAGW